MTLKTQWKKLQENWLLILLVVVLVGVLSLGNPVSQLTSTYKGGVATDMAMEELAYARGVPAPMGDFAPDVEERKITKTAYLATEVKRGKFQSAEDKLRSVLDASDSIIINENVYKQDNGREYYTGNWQIQVEADKYDSIVSQLKEIGEITSFNENALDITGQYLSLEDRLQTEKDRLARYEKLLLQAESTSDKLDLTDRIFNQEQTIKYLEDSLKRQDLRIEYTTVSVNIVEKQSEWVDIAVVKFSELVRRLVNSFNSVLSLLFWAVPWAILAGIVWFIYRRFK